jgi:hypothetical protein
MSALDAPQTAPPAGSGTRKLAVTVIVLAILPLLLPVPFYGLAALLIGPMDYAAWEQCASFNCPTATYLERLAWLLVLGPSILVAGGAILLGTIGLIRAQWFPTSSKQHDLFVGSVSCGVVWTVIVGSILWFGLSVLAGTII